VSARKHSGFTKRLNPREILLRAAVILGKLPDASDGAARENPLQENRAKKAAVHERYVEAFRWMLRARATKISWRAFIVAA
jgi:hypothetical protein